MTYKAKIRIQAGLIFKMWLTDTRDGYPLSKVSVKAETNVKELPCSEINRMQLCNSLNVSIANNKN